MNAELYYLVNCWEDLTPGAQKDIISILLADRVCKLPEHLIEDVQKSIGITLGAREEQYQKALKPQPKNGAKRS